MTITQTASMAEGIRPESLTVCLVTEGSYPHTKGGVSTWCDMLVRGLPEVRFVLLSLVASPSARVVYRLPENVAELITVPLWGTGEVLEIRRDLSLASVIRRKRSAPMAAVRDEFVPVFRRFLRLLWSPQAQPAAVGESLCAMFVYFQQRDFDTTMKSQPAWQCFVEESAAGYRGACQLAGLDQPATLLDVTDAMRLLYRWLTLLTVPVPSVDVIHSAAAGLCSVPGILARQEHHTAFLLTEHGVYLRERLLALARADGSLFERAFQARFAQRLTEASYYFADRIAPGSNYNHRWELRNGAQPDRIQTIYNGPDPAELTAVVAHRPEGAPPCVVWLGRIDPLKDVETLIRAASIVHGELPHVRFVLYGQAPKGNEWYLQRCESLRDQLGLRHTVIFGGFAASAAAAYNEGDFAVLSSISEGFPYSVVEAMMCGRTVVGTDVGGVGEALEGCGLVVEPRNPQQLADACLTLLRDPPLCRELGQKARAKAIERFSLQQCNAAYLAVFQHLATEARARRLLASGAVDLVSVNLDRVPAPLVVGASFGVSDRL
jgi:glycosyltransferase involved in cell wall biosynthesis